MARTTDLHERPTQFSSGVSATSEQVTSFLRRSNMEAVTPMTSSFEKIHAVVGKI
jgi:molecular chaperone GrpE (heat shock protein)